MQKFVITVVVVIIIILIEDIKYFMRFWDELDIEGKEGFRTLEQKRKSMNTDKKAGRLRAVHSEWEQSVREVGREMLGRLLMENLGKILISEVKSLCFIS